MYEAMKYIKMWSQFFLLDLNLCMSNNNINNNTEKKKKKKKQRI